MDIYAYAISQQGSAHVLAGQPCQDASATTWVLSSDGVTGYQISAIADGVGSCLLSQRGSAEAVEKVTEYLSSELQNMTDPDDTGILTLLEQAFNYAEEDVEILADREMMSVLEYDTTLTVTVYRGDGSLWYGHSGDGGVVALYADGTYGMLTHRHKGDEANSVFPLRFQEDWEFGKASKPAAAFAMMTDGVLDAHVGNELYDNRVYFPFFKLVLTALPESGAENEMHREHMAGILSSSEFRRRVTDDITLVRVMNSVLVTLLPSVEFDMEKWEQQTREVNERIQQELEESAMEQMRLLNQERISGMPHEDTPTGELAAEEDGEGAFQDQSGDCINRIMETTQGFLSEVVTQTRGFLRQVFRDLTQPVQTNLPQEDAEEYGLQHEDREPEVDESMPDQQEM